MTWNNFLSKQFQEQYFKDIVQFIKKERDNHKSIFPDNNNILNAFKLCNFSDIKVVILGQDPYYLPNQSNGLAFSVNMNIPIPKSLHNIYREIREDLNIETPMHGNLESWARQGVFLYNTCLTVESGKPNSHANIGWQEFTKNVLTKLSEDTEKSLVFLLWGKSAQNNQQYINARKHLILTATHPTPLSANKGFFGCKHFSKTNAFLMKNNIIPIEWGNI